MKRVTVAEDRLLRVVRSALHDGRAAPIASAQADVPLRLGAGAMALLEQTLATSVVLQLGRRGGWVPQPTLAHRAPARLWQRHSLPQLHFSAWSLLFCHRLAGGKERHEVDGALTAADEVVAYLCADAWSRTRLGPPPAEFGRSTLAWLGLPEALCEADTPPDLPGQLDTLLADPLGPAIAEALQRDLASRFAATETAKQHIGSTATMLRLGEAQEELYQAWLSAIERAGRRDLAELFVAGISLLWTQRPAPQAWGQRLDRRSSMADRARAIKAAAAGLRAVERVHGWCERFRHAHFIDDEYEEAQFLLDRWEPLLPAAEWARTIRRHLEALQEVQHDESRLSHTHQ